jgi:outer membrane protein TolC
MKNYRRNDWSLSTATCLIILSVAAFGMMSWGDAPPPSASSPMGAPTRLLKQTQAVLPIITLKEAFAIALNNHSSLLMAQNYLQRRRVENSMRIGALLPKIRLGGAYTRNIPEIETSPFASDSQMLNRHVASLLRNSGDSASAEQLERQADLMSRRRPDGKIVLSPKHVVDAKLTLEVPIFNGPDLARILASGESVLVQEARVRDEEAKTLFATAKAYYLALHQRNVLVLREQAEAGAEERFLKASAQRKRGIIMEKDYLHAHANFLQKQAERNASLIEYRASIGELGILVGQGDEFSVTEPDQIIAEPLSGDTEKLIEIALTHRPDLRAERQTLRVVENERFGAFLQFLPTFTAQGDAKYTSNDKSMVGKNFTYAISINAQLSIFDGGVGIGHLREINLRRKESEIKLAELRRDIDAKIRGRKERLTQLLMQVRALEAMTLAATESESVAASRHKRGMLDLQDLLEASDKRLNAEIAFKKAQSDVNEERLALIFEAGLLTPQLLQ